MITAQCSIVSKIELEMTVKRILLDCVLAEMCALEVKQLDLVHWWVAQEVLDVGIPPPGQWPGCAGMA